MQPHPFTLGVALPQGTHQELSTMEDPAAAWEHLESVAATAEDLGYDRIWLSDRSETLPRREPHPVFDGWTALGALARTTSRVGLGQVSLGAPFRNLGQVAKHAACVDVMSGGRLALAVDPRGYPAEHTSYGIPRPTPGTESTALRETLAGLRAAWRQPRARFDGEYVQLQDAYCEPAPLQDTLPVLVYEPRDEPSVAVAAALADGVVWHTPADEFAQLAQRLDERCHDAEREPSQVSRVALVECRIFDSVLDRDRWLATPHVVAFWSEHPDHYMQRNLVGTPSAVAAGLHRYLEAGAQQLIVWFRDYPALDSLHRFVDEVVPQVADAPVVA